MDRILKLLMMLIVFIVFAMALLNLKEPPDNSVALAQMAAISAGEPCTPGDQDPYVYRPERLLVIKPCLRITGTVIWLHIEDDGDVHYRVRPDPPYEPLLVPGNEAQDNSLVAEPVCYALPLHADALRLCASNPNRMASIPQVGDHVWMEGRYVLDIGHVSWAELHPLYRWGRVEQ
jgi:hypothetical protein